MHRWRYTDKVGLLGSALFLFGGVTGFALVQRIDAGTGSNERKPPLTRQNIRGSLAARSDSPPENDNKDRLDSASPFEKVTGHPEEPPDTTGEAVPPQESSDPFQVRLGFPRGIAVDASGTVFIADSGNNRVLKLTPQGKVLPVAGSMMWTFSGDGGPSVRAGISQPEDVAVDSKGNVYIADGGSTRIRKIDRDGVITTVAGTGQPGELLFSGDGGPATKARLSVMGLAVDAEDDLYFADTFSHRIRKIDRKGIITTVAGSGPDLQVDGEFGGYGDGGPATEAKLNQPNDIAFDPAGNMYIADAANYRIRKVDTDGIITTVAGTGDWQFHLEADGVPATKAGMNQCFGLAVDSKGNLYLSNSYNNRIRKVTPDGKIVTVAGSLDPMGGAYGGDGGPATKALLRTPHRIALDAKDNLYIMDSGNDRVRKLNTATGIITTIVGVGRPWEQGDQP